MLTVKGLIEKLKQIDPNATIDVDIGDDLVDAFYTNDGYNYKFGLDNNNPFEVYKNEKGTKRIVFTLKKYDTYEMSEDDFKEQFGYYEPTYPFEESWIRDK